MKTVARQSLTNAASDLTPQLFGGVPRSEISFISQIFVWFRLCARHGTESGAEEKSRELFKVPASRSLRLVVCILIIHFTGDEREALIRSRQRAELRQILAGSR